MRNSRPILFRSKVGHELDCKNLLQNRFYAIVLKTKKPYISLIYKVFTLFCSLLRLLSRVEDGARTTQNVFCISISY